MSTMKRYFTQIFTGVTGEFSSKRTVTFLAVIMMVIAFVAVVFFGVNVPQWLFENIVYVVMVGLGMVGAEQFGQLKHS